MKSLHFLLLACVGLSMAASDDETKLIGRRPKIILFGDSITQQSTGAWGWATLLADLYTRKADVVVRGFNGYTTNIARTIIEQAADIKADGNSTLLTIFFGANDACEPGHDMHVELDDYGQNLRSIVNKCEQKLPGITIVIISPPPIDDDKIAEFSWCAGRSNARVSAYAEESARAAQDTGSLFLDLYNLMMESENWRTFLSDGLHLSREGQRFLFDGLVSLVSSDPFARRWSPSNMPDHFPNFDSFFGMDTLVLRKVCEWPDHKGRYCTQQNHLDEL
mmetsp:Transcript_46496/g.145793  ORF Transcript_46496/g.145793 Transcript_46496/m.145793 type:complete len:278 (-) Transcript_46496:62-895(-)